MSADPGAGPVGPGSGGPGGQAPSEEQLRAAYEAELDRITAVDLMAQAAVSLLNVGARKLSPGGEGAGGAPAVGPDLEQAGDAIDGARALLEILERRIPKELGPLRDALARLQVAYARDARGAGSPASQPAGEGSSGQRQDAPQGAPGAQKGDGPGPAEASGRLWVPGR